MGDIVPFKNRPATRGRHADRGGSFGAGTHPLSEQHLEHIMEQMGIITSEGPTQVTNLNDHRHHKKGKE